MRTIRRLYFYAVTLVSLEVVLWGLISLLRTTFAANIVLGPETLAQALALILVGVPIFSLHWLWLQRTSARDLEEHTAILRPVFLYTVLIITLIPLIQNLLALIDRTFIETAGLGSYRAFIGGQQSWRDNIIAIVLNSIIATYFFTVVRIDWQILPDRTNFADVRRLYRYIWMLYALIMVIFGVQQILRYVFYIPAGMLGEVNREIFINGIALVVVGTPIWVYAWKICQGALTNTAERRSTLRLGILYLLSLSGVVTVLSTGGVVIDTTLRWAFGEQMTWQNFVRQIGGPISIGIPLAGIWGYYGYWLRREIDSVSDTTRRAGLKRFYFYILSLIGLTATFTGAAMLFSFVIDILTGEQALWGNVLRPHLTGAISTLLAGLPLWLMTWREMQAEALTIDDAGDHSRRSLVRKTYLYFILFASVIGVMGSSIWMVYLLINAILSGSLASDFLTNVLNAVQLLVLSAVVLLYHLTCLRHDGVQATDALEARQRKFPVIVFENEGSGFASSLLAALQKIAPAIPISVHTIEQGIPAKSTAQVVLMPSNLALDPPEILRSWLKGFTGQRIVVPVEMDDWYWIGSPPQNAAATAAHIMRQLAEGQEVHSPAPRPAWTIVAYVFAILFGLQVLFALFALAMSFITR
jgi:hypothetical protein